MPDTARWTREMVLALPDDGNRYELFDGELLVTPAPTGLHQVALSMLFASLLRYVNENRVGVALWSPADLSLGGEELSQPDCFVLPFLPADRSDWSGFPDPILVVEILSPSTAQFDRITKRRRFQRAAIPEYWIVDLDARVVERWTPVDQRPEILDAKLIWQPQGAALPFELDLPGYFREVWGR